LAHNISRSSILRSLDDLLSKARGTTANLEIEYHNSEGDTISMNLGEEWTVDVSDKFIDNLHQLFGKKNVQLKYDLGRLQNAALSRRNPAAQFIKYT